MIAIHRKNERIQSKVSDISLKPGDSLLLLAGADFMGKYEQSNDFYVVSVLETPDLLNENSWKSWFSIVLLVMMISLCINGMVNDA